VGRRTASSLDLVEEVEFVVEQAGCSSCAGRVRRALEAIATVEAIEIDESADAADVRLRTLIRVSEGTVSRALREASVGSGHEYSVQPGSWRALSVGT
jgi:copper chaperone CopZ